MPRLTLIGYRGTGKSTVAAALAGRLACGVCDADRLLEERFGCTIGEMIRSRGEAAFRDAEEALLGELLDDCAGVLSTGGGVVLRPANRLELRRRGRPVVWLDARADVVRGRLAADPATMLRRPGLTGPDPLAEVEAALSFRLPLYASCADLRVDTSTAQPEAIAAAVAAWLADAWPAVATAPRPWAGPPPGVTP
jgi:shikimate kinase